MSIKPVKKGSRTSGQFNNSIGERKKKKKKEAVNAYLIKNSKGVGRTGLNYMSV